MILSNKSIFSDKQAITVTARSTNVIDLNAKGTPYGGKAAMPTDIGQGTEVPIEIIVTESFATLTSLTVAVETGAADTLGTILSSVTVPAATLVKGYRLPIKNLPSKITGRYLGLRYTVAGSDATTGKITAGLTMGNQTSPSEF